MTINVNFVKVTITMEDGTVLSEKVVFPNTSVIPHAWFADDINSVIGENFNVVDTKEEMEELLDQVDNER